MASLLDLDRLERDRLLLLDDGAGCEDRSGTCCATGAPHDPAASIHARRECRNGARPIIVTCYAS